MTPQACAAPAALYACKVMHARMRPVPHRFSYRIFTILLDLDRLDEAARMSRLFSIGRFNLLSFRPEDHGARDGRLRQHADRLLREAGLAAPAARILLLAMPRVLGFAFNPISIYYCLDENRSIVALIAEVRNTFGESHTYVAPAEAAREGFRAERDKLFYVSPFFDMAMRYKFRLSTPDDALRFRILMDAPDGPIFAAAMAGERRPFTARALLGAFFKTPLMGLQVLGEIHFEALRLWIKGLKIRSRPKPPAGPSFDDSGPFTQEKTLL